MSDIKSIAQIKQEFEQSGDDKEALYVQYAGDSRKGVQNLITKYQKEAQKLVKERERLETMRFFEHKYSEYHAICGIDEAGRGPLAGPVVAGAVILPEDVEILYLNDSKKLSAARREELYEEIKEKAICYGVGIASPERIDQINILQATYEAMRDAIAALMPAPDLLLVAGVLHRRVELFAEVRRDSVVRVHKGHPLAPGGVQPGVAGPAQTPVFLVHHPDAAVFGRRRVAQSRAVVRRAVVH